MPNHCEGDLTIRGDADEVAAFLARYVTAEDGACLNLDAVRPYPEVWRQADAAAEEWDRRRFDAGPMTPEAYAAFVAEYGERPPDGYSRGGYEWRCEQWGTKWGCYRGAIERPADDVRVLHFRTAWSPFDLSLLAEMSRAFPSLALQYDYYECGMGFQGHVRATGGVLVEQSEGAYDGERGG